MRTCYSDAYGKHVHEINAPLHTPLLCSETGVYSCKQFFLFIAQNIDCGYSFELGLMYTHNLCFEHKMRKLSFFFFFSIQNHLLLPIKTILCIVWECFRNACKAIMRHLHPQHASALCCVNRLFFLKLDINPLLMNGFTHRHYSGLLST